MNNYRRREWDSNPRDPSPGPSVFKTDAFVRSAIPPKLRVSQSRGGRIHAADRRHVHALPASRYLPSDAGGTRSVPHHERRAGGVPPTHQPRPSGHRGIGDRTGDLLQPGPAHPHQAARRPPARHGYGLQHRRHHLAPGCRGHQPRGRRHRHADRVAGRHGRHHRERVPNRGEGQPPGRPHPPLPRFRPFRHHLHPRVDHRREPCRSAGGRGGRVGAAPQADRARLAGQPERRHPLEPSTSATSPSANPPAAPSSPDSWRAARPTPSWSSPTTGSGATCGGRRGTGS